MTTLYKSLKANLKSHGNFTWEVNKWMHEDGKIEACKNGFHASKNIIDAMGFVDMECLALVEVKGKSDKQTNKEAWSDMRIKKAWKWEKEDSVALSIFAAELVIKMFEKEYPNDKRPREAIESAKKWLKEPTKENTYAAAAYTATYAAAAYTAVAAASAYAAAYASSKEKAREKILKQCHDWIIKRTKQLTEIK